jgi:hypothetical protein
MVETWGAVVVEDAGQGYIEAARTVVELRAAGGWGQR